MVYWLLGRRTEGPTAAAAVVAAVVDVPAPSRLGVKVVGKAVAGAMQAGPDVRAAEQDIHVPHALDLPEPVEEVCKYGSRLLRRAALPAMIRGDKTRENKKRQEGRRRRRGS